MISSKNRIIGFHSTIEAIEAGKEMDRLFIRKGLKGDLFSQLFKLVKERNIPYSFVPPEKLNRITSKNHQGVIAIVSPVEYQSIYQMIPFLYEAGKVPFIVLLDGVTDVRNFGAIARTAESAGVDAIVIPAKNSVSVTSDSVKTSSGALLRIPVCRHTDMKEVINYCKESGLQIFAATEKAPANYYKNNFNLPLVLIMGSEEKGIHPDLLKLSDNQVSIPMMGEMASLNVSVAFGVIAYEVCRQRTG
jgi:23S rRNA (guanosine2251-2'-O)-methyltransferase